MLQGVGSWEGRVWRKALLPFPAAPANVHTILAVSLVITIHLCVLIISRNLVVVRWPGPIPRAQVAYN